MSEPNITREHAKAMDARMARRVEAAKLRAKALAVAEDHIVLHAQEDLPMPAYMRAEMLVEALERAGVLGSYGSQREQGLNVQEGGRAPSDRRPPYSPTDEPNIGGWPG